VKGNVSEHLFFRVSFAKSFRNEGKFLNFFSLSSEEKEER
jgi:hypothetical protein